MVSALSELSVIAWQYGAAYQEFKVRSALLRGFALLRRNALLCTSVLVEVAVVLISLLLSQTHSPFFVQNSSTTGARSLAEVLVDAAKRLNVQIFFSAVVDVLVTFLLKKIRDIIQFSFNTDADRRVRVEICYPLTRIRCYTFTTEYKLIFVYALLHCHA